MRKRICRNCEAWQWGAWISGKPFCHNDKAIIQFRASALMPACILFEWRRGLTMAGKQDRAETR
jgi:hypothetical protein